VVSVQDEDAVECALDHRVHLVLFARGGEHHAQEVAGVRQIVLRVHEGLADAVLVSHGDQGRQLGDQADGRDFTVLRVVDVGAVVVEGRQTTHQTGQHSHRVSVTAETTQEELHLFVHHRVLGDTVGEVGLLRGVRQFTVQQQVAGFQEVAVHSQLLDGVAAVQQFALVAIDVGDGRLARGRRQKARVVGEHAGLGVQLADVDDVRTDVAVVDRQVNAGAAVAERQGGFIVS